ncbi:hypothetical protein SDC9_11490 [bioreactor metagenome]|uniref:DUF3793 domain-containing protein n=1 Tax=bioreactor metagenome TaxID=1076179 RepID=A0A644TFT9_9ZZZZ|nr:DUF3793 family protein [Negativicutes bacterium]
MIRSSNHCGEQVDNWTEWLVENLASTIVGNKPSTILTMADTRTLPLLTIWRCAGLSVLSGMIIHFKILSKSAKKETVLFYREDILTNCINDRGNRSFLQTMGYPVDSGLHACLEVLEERFQGCCPHEVGVLLGIPLKDVLGFMQVSDLPLTCRRHWCIYGNPEESLAIMQQYLNDQSYVCRLMAKGLPPYQILCGQWNKDFYSTTLAS